jgi:uncharacterized membrane protein
LIALAGCGSVRAEHGQEAEVTKERGEGRLAHRASQEKKGEQTMWGLIVMQWLHVLLGLFWFGSTLYLDVVVIPAVMTLSLEQQRTVSKLLTTFSERVIIPAGILVILLGLVRGILLGPVRSLDFLFGTAYGLTFLIAFLAALATFAWSRLVLARAARRLDTFPLADVLQPEGKVARAFASQVQRVKRFALLELFGFFIIFTCMILMRFDL